jgi:pilus assembly protein CpaC
VTHSPFSPGRFGAGAALVLLVALATAQTAAQQAAPPAGTPQTAPQQAAPPPAAAPVEKPADGGRVALTAGRSTVVGTDFDIVRVAITNPTVADATVVAPREILIDGKAAGTISMIVWGGGRRLQYDLVVEPTITTLQQNLRTLFPGEDINVNVNDEAIILSGHASSTAVMLKAGEIAQASSSKAKVINLLQLPGGAGSQQVMLQVRVAEVNYRALTELGLNYFTGADGYKNWVGRSTTQQFSAPIFDQDKTTFSDFLNLFVFNTKYNMGVVIRALKQTGALQSLAEPNLIAYNGQEASFLAGGEFPVPIVQGSGQAATVTIMFKEFGVRLNFKPTIAGDVIRLKVRPEVSTLDFTNGITLQGFRVPALTTRRAETDVELRDGQSFAIAGLVDNLAQNDKSAIPFLSAIPIIGNLFKSKADRKERTELMVLITPQLVKPLEPDEVPPLPVDLRRFLPGGGIGSEMEGGGGLADPAKAKPGDTSKAPAAPAKPPVKKRP